MERSSLNHLNERYFGRVVDNFTCADASMHKCLAIAMGEYLFYHIVDTYHTASSIISAMNEAEMPGEVNFFVLNIIDGSDYPEHSLISRLSFDAKFQKLFAKICSELPMDVDRIHTMLNDTTNACDYEFIEENGTLIGIDISPDTNSVELYHQHQELLNEEDAVRYELSENSLRLDSTLSRIADTSQTLIQQQSTMSSIQQVQLIVTNLTHAIRGCEARLRSKTVELQKIEAKIKELAESKCRYEEELKQKMLTDEESQRIQAVQTQIVEKRMQVHRVNSDIGSLQSRRNTISDFFENSLMSRYSTLREQTENHSKNLEELARLQDELRDAEEWQRNSQSISVEIGRQILKLHNDQEAKKIRLVELDKQKIDLMEKQKQLFVEMDTLKVIKKNQTSEMNWLKMQKPYDATTIHNRDIVGMSEDDIDNQLSVARHQLNTYQNSNSIDVNLLDTFKRDRNNFMQRRNDLKTFEQKIQLAMKKIDASINGAMRTTFNHLSKLFSSNFTRFMPGGSARLNLIEATEQSDDQNASEFIGLEIFARFLNEEKPFAELFFEERRVTAVTLIISLQQLCPAPFYLFDSIDEVIMMITS